jgi:Phosphotransferase enzyme family
VVRVPATSAITSPEDGLGIPERAEEITAGWLSQALAVRYQQTEVTLVHTGRVIHGSGTKIRLVLEYNDVGHGHRLPPTMWVKTGYEPHSDMIRNSYVGEKNFYRDVGRTGLINAPYCYFGGTDADTGLTLLLLEDLLARNAGFGLATRPLDVQTVDRALEMMARYHAVWWAAPQLASLGEFGGSFVSDDIIFALIDSEGWERWVNEPRGSRVPAEYRSRDAIRRAYRRLWELEREGAPCLLHGDPHLGNMFFEPDGTPGFLDWQRVMQGHWAHDVAYFVISALEPELCAAHERELLSRYLERRASFGAPAMDFNAAFLAYRRQALHGLVWVINPLTMQPEEVNSANAHRFGAATARLDSWAALFGAAR